MNARMERLLVPCRWLLATLAIVAGSLSACGGTEGKAAETTTGTSTAPAAADNWNFETGDFTGWRTRSTGSGAWHVYTDGATPPDPTDTDPNFPFRVPDPPEGNFAAVTDMSAPGTRIMHRDLELDGRFDLRFTLFYVMYNGGEFAVPPSLDFRINEPNQQFRVDLMDPAAPIDSLASKHVLARIFRTEPGDPGNLGPRDVTFDLSRWTGQKVRIRFAQVDNRGPLRAGVDAVRLDAQP